MEKLIYGLIGIVAICTAGFAYGYFTTRNKYKNKK